LGWPGLRPRSTTGFAKDAPLNWTIGQLTDKTVIFGFAPDGLNRVLVNGHAVGVIRNAFFIELPKQAVTSLIAVSTDGTRQPLALGS